MKARQHPDQAARLEALRAYGVLDTERESEFDDIVELASAICQTPIAVINLIDEGRQWFKAETGLGVRETPLDTSICSHVILEREFTEIRDTLSDPRTADNPLCLGRPGLRFYAGALLKDENGLPMGTLCVLDHAPRSLTPVQRETLRLLARQVMTLLDLRMALAREEILRREVDHRVKNSLQSVSALTRLQARRMKGEEVRAALDVVAHRIETVAALHDELYRAGSGNRIALARLMENIRTYVAGSGPENVNVELDVEGVILESRQAGAVAVIVNEFVANSFKHAFPDGRAGRIRIAARDLEGGRVELTCADDGIGLAAEVGESDGLGMKVIGASSQQLGGTFELLPAEPGVKMRVLFDRG